MLDLQNGYFKIPVKHNNRHKTVSILLWDKYQGKRLRLGLLGAPFTFTEAMLSIFSDLSSVVVYFDDMLVLLESTEQHLDFLIIVFEHLVQFGLHINKTKNQIFWKQVNFLGFAINQ